MRIKDLFCKLGFHKEKSYLRRGYMWATHIDEFWREEFVTIFHHKCINPRCSLFDDVSVNKKFGKKEEMSPQKFEEELKSYKVIEQDL